MAAQETSASRAGAHRSVSQDSTNQASSSATAGPGPFTAAELIFLGTGASDEVPNASCLLFGREPPCPACLSAQLPGSRDRRRQTSAVMKLYQRDGNFKTILIDAGWTLSASILDVFPKHGISKLDAVFITHEHADALNGLPFLRGWTLRGFQSSIDVYTSQRTFKNISKCFPYLVSPIQGGPASTAFRFHETPVNGPFTCLDGALQVHALALHHGGKSRQEPFISTGYSFFNSRLVYMSDVNYIPESTWDTITSSTSRYLDQQPEQVGTEFFIVDCLKVEPSPGHFGLGQSLAAAKRLKAKHTYFTQVSDGLSHAQLTQCCRTIAGCQDETAAAPFLKALGETMQTDQVPQDIRQVSRIQHRRRGVPDDNLDALKGFTLQQALEHGGLGAQNAQPGYDGQVLRMDFAQA